MRTSLQKSTNWNVLSKLFEDDSKDYKNQFVGFVSSHKKGTLLTSFHVHSFVVFHTDLQKNTIVTCILTSGNHMMSYMQDQLLQLLQSIQYHQASSFSTIITSHFIGEEFCLGQTSINGYGAMGFDITQLTQDEEQSLFTIKTNMPITMLGVVHAYVDQKILKSNKIKSLIDVQNIGSRHCSNKYKLNRITTLSYAILSVNPPHKLYT
jgi:hypothetical protein